MPALFLAIDDFFDTDWTDLLIGRGASCPLDNDGRSDVILARGPNARPKVTLIDPDTGFQFRSFLAFDTTMTAGQLVKAAFR